jgi:type IV pilus assembly protein PilV
MSSKVDTMRRPSSIQWQNEQGFSLLEGMVAAVILGIGLLGMSGMQAISLVKNVDANELTRVTSAASEMMERIYFNRRNAASYNGIDTQSATNCTTISSTTQAQARGDCLLWDSLVDGTQLQNVKGTVSVSNVIAPTVLGQRTVTVTITWMGSMNSGSTTKRSRSLTLNRVIAPE